jgi:5-formyltetrahydrofolate cyclo-ligase
MVSPEQNRNLSKSQIREKIRLDISSISFAERSHQEQMLTTNLDLWLDQIKAVRGDLILAFWPSLTEEPDFRSWLHSLKGKGICYALPRLEWPTRTIRFFKVSSPELDLEFAANGLGQPCKSLEPIHLDQPVGILVPGLAFDLSGGRLGRGAGFYDRTLISFRVDIPRWGIGFSEQLIPEVPLDVWDQPLNGLILPQGLVRT